MESPPVTPRVPARLKKMDMVGHYDESLEAESLEGLVMTQRLDHQARD